MQGRAIITMQYTMSRASRDTTIELNAHYFKMETDGLDKITINVFGK
jgi:hypothetical protein